MDSRIAAALAKLDPGSYSLVLCGFACRAIKRKPELMTAREMNQLRELMMATGLPHRRVRSDDVMVDCWDYVK